MLLACRGTAVRGEAEITHATRTRVRERGLRKRTWEGNAALRLAQSKTCSVYCKFAQKQNLQCIPLQCIPQGTTRGGGGGGMHAVSHLSFIGRACVMAACALVQRIPEG